MNKNKESNLLNIIKAHTWEILLVILLLLPALIQTNFLYVGTWLLNFIHIGKPANWLGFWGSYLGSIFAIIFAYENTKIQLKKNKENDIDKYKIDKLANLMSIIIDRRNEFKVLKSNANNLAEMFEVPNSNVNVDNNEEFNGYVQNDENLKNLNEKKFNEISSDNLIQLENSHVSDWNKNFVIFDEKSPYISDILNDWNNISEAIDNYKQTSINILSVKKEFKEIILHQTTSSKGEESCNKTISSDQTQFFNKASKTFKKSYDQLKEMEDTCEVIYNKLHDMCNNLMR